MAIELRKSDSGAFRQTIRINQHTIFADIAASIGGDNSAPDPHDLYDASLAACKAITVMMYAKNKNIPLDYLDIDVERDTTQEAKGLYVIKVKLKFFGKLAESDKQKLTEIAGKCPIHKLMTQSETQVITEVM
ncbi:OsmC family protein [Rheinheimera oceanensis]|uniref:OsmC family protein n=1 Tax=Rheinheimera oceanensis TaxID=2817449 RepID=UPI001BFDB52A|nr:OsmC family protein [Rheinheimera oceanensis]